MIIAAGYRIGPFEVESACIEHPAVREAAAVASPDERRGNVVKAFIVLAEGHEPSDALADEIKAFVRDRLSAYAYPRRVEFVDRPAQDADRQDPAHRAARAGGGVGGRGARRLLEAVAEAVAPGGLNSALADQSPWRKPSRQLGQRGAQPSTRRALALDAPRDSVIIVTGDLAGGQAAQPAPGRAAAAGAPSGVGQRRQPLGGRARARRRRRCRCRARPRSSAATVAAGGVVDVDERPDAAAVADDRQAALAHSSAHARRRARSAGARAVEAAVAQHDALEPVARAGHGRLEVADRVAATRAGASAAVGVERVVLVLDRPAARGRTASRRSSGRRSRRAPAARAGVEQVVACPRCAAGW